MKIVKRNEDMSEDGILSVLQQPDGDIIVAIRAKDEFGNMQNASVEFCNCGNGGGRSPYTKKALANLIEAIEIDNKMN